MLAEFLTVYLNAQNHYENHKTDEKSPNLIDWD